MKQITYFFAAILFCLYATPSQSASIYLDTDDNFTVSNSGATVYGGSGNDTVTVSAGITGVALDQNVELIYLSGASSSYAFMQTGNKINVYDATGATLLFSIPVQGDTDGTVLSFSDVSVSAMLSSGIMSLGGVTVSTTAPTPISLIGSCTVSLRQACVK